MDYYSVNSNLVIYQVSAHNALKKIYLVYDLFIGATFNLMEYSLVSAEIEINFDLIHKDFE